MKIRILIGIVIALALTMAVQFVDTSSTVADTIAERPELFRATLISPTAGQVLHPGEVVLVEWTAVVPSIDPDRCESEVLLSVNGGANAYFISPQFDGNVRSFYWTVPNLPTNKAALLIRYGCHWQFPESVSPQTQSEFVIAPAGHE